MKKNYKARQYDITKTEARFEQLLEKNGYKILGVKEFNSKTDYLISKDDMQITYSIHVYGVDTAKHGDIAFKIFQDYEQLKRQTSRKGVK